MPWLERLHCYAYDPSTGKWEDFVEGTVQLSSVDGTSPVLSASIRHFSWYGGAPEGDDCVDVYVKVVSAVDGRPLGNARVEATPGTTRTFGRVDEDLDGLTQKPCTGEPSPTPGQSGVRGSQGTPLVLEVGRVKDITGQGVTGLFYSFANSSEQITFTVE